MSDEQSERPFECGYCGKTFTTISDLKTHVYVHNRRSNEPKSKSEPKLKCERKSQSKKFECEECGRGYKTNVKLLLHLTTHTGIKPYACDMCDVRFSVIVELNRHKMLHTGEKPYKCNYCPASFLIRSDLERHDMAHTGNKPFKCTLCDYSCVRKPILEYHMNTHTGETPFKCDFYGCGVEYASPATLKKHKLKHGPPPLKTCKVCKEKFPDLNSLKRHMVIHPGNKPVPCDQCDKIFYSESTLKRHLHVHMYKPPGHKKNVVIKRNGGVKKAGRSGTPKKKFSSEYQVLAAAENGHGSLAHSWTINAEDANRQQYFHHSFPASQLNNRNAWPSTMDPNELRHRLLNSFK